MNSSADCSLMKTKILADSQICISVPLMVSGNDLRRRFSQGKCLTFSQQLLSTEYVNIGFKCQIILNVSIYGIEHSANLSLCANVNSYYCCVCVCLYSSTCWFLLVARRLWYTWEVRIYALLLRVFLGASAEFLHLYFWIYHISPPKTKTPADSYWRENEWYNAGTRKDDIYWYRIKVGYNYHIKKIFLGICH